MSSQNENNENNQAPPAGLDLMHSMALAYKDYVSYLKDGGPSGISGAFGKLTLKEASQRLSAISQSSIGTEQQAAGELASKQILGLHEQDNSCTLEAKMQAVYEIIAGMATPEDIARRHNIDEAIPQRWVEVAFIGMEAALRAAALSD